MSATYELLKNKIKLKQFESMSEARFNINSHLVAGRINNHEYTKLRCFLIDSYK